MFLNRFLYKILNKKTLRFSATPVIACVSSLRACEAIQVHIRSLDCFVPRNDGETTSRNDGVTNYEM